MRKLSKPATACSSSVLPQRSQACFGMEAACPPSPEPELRPVISVDVWSEHNVEERTRRGTATDRSPMSAPKTPERGGSACLRSRLRWASGGCIAAASTPGPQPREAHSSWQGTRSESPSDWPSKPCLGHADLKPPVIDRSPRIPPAQAGTPSALGMLSCCARRFPFPDVAREVLER